MLIKKKKKPYCGSSYILSTTLKNLKIDSGSEILSILKETLQYEEILNQKKRAKVPCNIDLES